MWHLAYGIAKRLDVLLLGSLNRCSKRASILKHISLNARKRQTTDDSRQPVNWLRTHLSINTRTQKEQEGEGGEGQILMHYVALVILNVNTLETCRKDINYSIDSLHKNILIPTAMAMMIMEAIMKMLHCLLTLLCGLPSIPRAKGTRILLFVCNTFTNKSNFHPKRSVEFFTSHLLRGILKSRNNYSSCEQSNSFLAHAIKLPL